MSAPDPVSALRRIEDDLEQLRRIEQRGYHRQQDLAAKLRALLNARG